MAQYIDKSALATEIEKCYNECLKRVRITDSYYWNAKADAYRNVLAIFNDTLEVKEVDLEKEVNTYMDNEMKFLSDEVGYDTLLSIAHYFFELGLKSQKGE